MATKSRVGSGNISGTGVTVRIVVGIILLALAIFRFVVGFWAGVFVTAGIVAFMTAFTRTCPATTAWNLWFGGGSSPAPKRLTGGGPEPGQSSASAKGSSGGHGRSESEKRDASGAESGSGGGKHGGDSDKDQ